LFIFVNFTLPFLPEREFPDETPRYIAFHFYRSVILYQAQAMVLFIVLALAVGLVLNGTTATVVPENQRRRIRGGIKGVSAATHQKARKLEKSSTSYGNVFTHELHEFSGKSKTVSPKRDGSDEGGPQQVAGENTQPNSSTDTDSTTAKPSSKDYLANTADNPPILKEITYGYGSGSDDKTLEPQSTGDSEDGWVPQQTPNEVSNKDDSIKSADKKNKQLAQKRSKSNPRHKVKDANKLKIAKSHDESLDDYPSLNNNGKGQPDKAADESSKAQDDHESNESNNEAVPTTFITESSSPPTTKSSQSTPIPTKAAQIKPTEEPKAADLEPIESPVSDTQRPAKSPSRRPVIIPTRSPTSSPTKMPSSEFPTVDSQTAQTRSPVLSPQSTNNSYWGVVAVLPTVEEEDEEDALVEWDCPSNVVQFQSQLEVEFVGSPELLTAQEVASIERTLATLYNTETMFACDIYTRTILDAQLQFETNSFVYIVSAACRDCPVDTTLFESTKTTQTEAPTETRQGSFFLTEDYFSTLTRQQRSASASAHSYYGFFEQITPPEKYGRTGHNHNKEGDRNRNLQILEQCFCPEGVEPTVPMAPTTEEFLAIQNEAMEQLRTAGILTNVVSIRTLREQ